jgi:hypothetical protein
VRAGLEAAGRADSVTVVEMRSALIAGEIKLG